MLLCEVFWNRRSVCTCLFSSGENTMPYNMDLSGKKYLLTQCNVALPSIVFDLCAKNSTIIACYSRSCGCMKTVKTYVLSHVRILVAAVKKSFLVACHF